MVKLILQISKHFFTGNGSVTAGLAPYIGAPSLTHCFSGCLALADFANRGKMVLRLHETLTCFFSQRPASGAPFGLGY
jgi:hypothetical protein